MENVMSYIQCTPEQPQLIAVNRLEKSPLNARRTHAKMGMDELKSSILSHGLMQNLVVTDKGDGIFRVIAGGRRLEAIQSLQTEGKLPEDFAVPCQVVTEEHALEMSLAENTVRLAMHPADQFEAFAALIEKGESAADVAVRFGVEESFVLKRMKLARVTPELLDEYRSDNLSLECLQAYTVTDDHRRQLKVYKSLQGWQKDDPTAIRAALTEKMVESSDKLARFVGLDVYRDAGGPTREDLFGEEVFLEKPALLHKLAEAKLTGIRKELETEGWAWIEINPERDYDAIHRCGRLKPQLVAVPNDLVELKSQLDSELLEIENAIADEESDALLDKQEEVQERLDEVERKLAGYVGYDATQKALAGCFVSIGHDGSLHIDKGLVKPEQRKLLSKLLGQEDDKPVKARPKDGLPESLRRDLAVDRLEVAQVALAGNPDVAMDILTFQTARAMLADEAAWDGPKVQFHRPRLGKECEPSTAQRKFAEIGKALPTEWLKAKSEAEQFEAFRSLPQSDRQRLLAYCIAITLQPKLGPSAGEEASAFDIALSLTALRVADYWRPARSFFNRCKRDQLLAIGREVMDGNWAEAHASEKKSTLVSQFERLFSNPDKSGRAADQIEKLKSWLPTGMAFHIASPPKPAKSRKARKAA
jgi:ParB family chromosome partitioning protein